MKKIPILLAAFIGCISLSQSQEIPIQQETLGQWHYLHRLNETVFSITQTFPVAIAFGASNSRAAVLPPGSNLVAEFKAGHFFDLRFPTDLTPCSLATDNQGRLYCLGQKLITSGYGYDDRWITSLNEKTWSPPRKVPFNLCDQIVFDRQNRLWALGPARIVAVNRDGTWDTFAYSDDKNLRFAPIRLASNLKGEPVLFSYWQPWDMSRMVGTLTYNAGQFVRDPQADTTAYIQAQKVKEPENATIPTDPAAGYVIEPFRGLHARTQLKWKGYTIVSLGTDGLAWTGPADAVTPPLAVEKEWEPVTHVQFDPTLDSQGNLWVLRRNPSVLLKVTAQGTEQFPIGPETRHPELFTTIKFDTLGRAWLTWCCGTSFEVDIFDHDAFVHYPDLASALRAESPKFAPGRILSFATKTPSGLIAYGGWNGQADAITVMNLGKETRFQASDIDPSEPANRPTTGHGYNPFRNSDLWFDKDGFLHTRVLDSDFKYADGKWTPSTLTQEKDSVVPPLPIEKGDPVSSPVTSNAMPWGTSKTVFHGFHFYRIEGDGEKQLDFGLNPLATYPFWSGVIPAALDPQDRIWVGDMGRGFHPNDATWYVEHNRQNSNSPL